MHADPRDDFDTYVDSYAPAPAETILPGDDAEPPRLPLASRVGAAMQPFTTEELNAAAESHPHAFEDGETGLFPIGEVSIVAAQGREGKTYSLVAIAAGYVRGKRLGGLLPAKDRHAVIYSAEDDRKQYARKVAALRWLHGDTSSSATWCDRLIVPDLDAPDVAEWRELVKVIDRRPIKAPMVNALIDALTPRMTDPVPPGLLIFETASTLSDAEEDNAGLRTLVGALKQIARELGVAVVLVHHTSQAGTKELSTLSIGVSDIRGGTALVYNARQCFMLINLGSDDDPFAETDARTLLRKLAAPNDTARISALICLDSSKARDPAPIFLRWRSTPSFGPALEEITPPSSIAGQRWRKVLAMLHGKRAEARDDAKATETAVKVTGVVEAVRKLQASNTPASAKAVSVACGRTKEWALPYLQRAVEQGLLTTSVERLKQAPREVTIYHAIDWAEGETE
ncbi:AAA family ATPase [Rhodanobacter sp. DHG33]|uniref:AAA family ATPase n=1 Tax=Rhodanobacter sp. DHG33 TaxID=2775921 RepID=UPI00177B3A61|nr:AAA family ATPase [Rhodanobacter sp. DHG33]MBD8898373.1 AAA family ATPase [Rhodanobacter sp. DHG33]